MRDYVAIYGAGGFAREVAWLVQSLGRGRSVFEIACFIDDDTVRRGEPLNGIPRLTLEQARDRFPAAQVAVAVGSPAAREKLVQRAAGVGFRFATLVHPRVERSTRVRIGEGSVVCAGCILTTDIQIGRHAQINLGCTVGHDVVMEDYATLAPGVHLSGCVHIGQRAYLGSGAVVINGRPGEPLIIGDDAVVGAGAVVTRAVTAGTTVVGVPARPGRRRA